jgi:hypothetical protein
VRKQGPLAKWIIKAREEIAAQDEASNADYLRRVAANMITMCAPAPISFI